MNFEKYTELSKINVKDKNMLNQIISSFIGSGEIGIFVNVENDNYRKYVGHTNGIYINNSITPVYRLTKDEFKPLLDFFKKHDDFTFSDIEPYRITKSLYYKIKTK